MDWGKILGIGLKFETSATRSDVHRKSSPMAAIVYGVKDYQFKARWGADRGYERGKSRVQNPVQAVRP